MPATDAMLITEDYINSPSLIMLSLIPIKLGRIPLESLALHSCKPVMEKNMALLVSKLPVFSLGPIISTYLLIQRKYPKQNMQAMICLCKYFNLHWFHLSCIDLCVS